MQKPVTQNKLIYILGPTVTNSYFGGVATFDDELATSLKKIGWRVRQFSNQADLVPQTTVTHFRVSHFRKLVKDEQPDLILASLQYGLAFMGLKTSAKKIYFLHGFFNQSSYGNFRAKANSFIQRQMVQASDLVISNSYFTKMVNKEFFSIQSTTVQHLGVSQEFIKQLKKESDGIHRANDTLLFAGRLVKAKGIVELVNAVVVLKKMHVPISLEIAGEGELRPWIEQQIAKHKLPITLLGKLNQSELVAHYCQSGQLISLNPSEPFGITYAEALAANCKLICPYTGGQVERLVSGNYQNQVFFVDEDSPESIAMGIKQAMQVPVRPIDLTNLDKWSYDSVAKQLIKKVGY